MKYQRFKEYFNQIPFILTFIILLGFVFGLGRVDVHAVSTGDVSLGGTGKVIRAATVALAAFLGIFILAKSRGIKYLLTKNNGLLMLFVFLCFSSMVFSPAKMLTLYKAFEIFSMSIILAILYQKMAINQAETVRYFYAIFWVYTITVVGVYAQLMVFGVEGQRQLLGAQPFFGFMVWSRYPGMAGNSLGFLGALVALFGVHLTSVKKSSSGYYRSLGLLVFIFGLGVTVLSYTRSVLVFLFVAIILYFILRKKFSVSIILVVLLLAPLLIPKVQDKIVEHLKRGDTEESLTTMSGRTEMWAAVFSRDITLLMAGSGYATGSHFMGFEETGKTLKTANVHNGFLEVVMSIGLVGGLVWLAISLRIFYSLHTFYRRVFKKLSTVDKDFHAFICCIFFLCYARSLMNSTFVYLDYFFPVLMGMMAYGDSLRAKEVIINTISFNNDVGDELSNSIDEQQKTVVKKYTGVKLR